MDDYVTKPFRARELVEMVEMVERHSAGNNPWPGDSVAAVEPLADCAVFDGAAFLAIADGDEQLRNEIVQVYFAEYPRLLDQIHNASACNDCEALEFSAHALKSSVGNMAASRAHRVTENIEMLARAGKLSEAQNQLVILERELASLHDHLKNLLLEPAL